MNDTEIGFTGSELISLVYFSEFNMALLKAASQSETLWNYDPNLAVDGDSNTCSFTPQSDVQRWWQVSDFFYLWASKKSLEVYLLYGDLYKKALENEQTFYREVIGEWLSM